MTEHGRLQRAAGTRNFGDLLRSRGRAPKEDVKLEDVEAVKSGPGRTVSCALRGSTEPFPKRFKHGMIDLVPGRAVWRPYWWSLKRGTVSIDSHVLAAKSRARNPRTDWNIKSGGMHKSDGLLPSTGFTVIVFTTESGWFELAVPTPDVRLVTTFFTTSS